MGAIADIMIHNQIKPGSIRIELKLGDTIFLLKEFCDHYRIPDDAKTLKRIHPNGDENSYTIKYGSGGHDVNVGAIDWDRTRQYRRDKLLESILDY